MAQGFDYVIVGGGSAGCVLAARLTENPETRVCLIEAGGRDTHPLIHVPAGFSRMTAGPMTWGLTTAPQTHADNREIPYAQARVLGGGSSINAQVFTRGHPSDYDRWVTEGAIGWGFDDIRKYFVRAEGNTALAGGWHGTDGPMGVSNIVEPQRTTRAFVQACQEFGMPLTADFNGPAQMGTGIYQTTTKNARRCSAAVGYLRPALSRPNLTLVTGALVHRIRVQGTRATGVEYAVKGQTTIAHAEAEVIVTAGAIGSPKLLLLSGIGPASDLAALGIPVAHDLPGVGRNLTDHFGVDIVGQLKDHVSLDRYNKPLWALWAGLQYALFKSGPVSSNIVEGGAFWSSDPSRPVPDLQFHFLAGAGAEAGVPTVPKGSSGVTLNSYALRPGSRGSVTLRSADPAARPIVDPNYLADPDDLRLAVEGLKISRQIFAQPSLQKYLAAVSVPDASVRTQADHEAFARRYGRTSYHPVGTCRMGQGGDAVVDPALRVHGLDGLRVCDSSVMPSLIGSNTNAATIMIGEKAADLIRGNG